MAANYINNQYETSFNKSLMLSSGQQSIQSQQKPSTILPIFPHRGNDTPSTPFKQLPQTNILPQNTSQHIPQLPPIQNTPPSQRHNIHHNQNTQNTQNISSFPVKNINTPAYPTKYSDMLIDIKYDSSARHKTSSNYELISPNNNIHRTEYQTEYNTKLEKVSDKIYNHFKEKYPTSINATGLSPITIKKIVDTAFKKQNTLTTPNTNIISNIIDVIDIKLRSAIHSENRSGKTFDTTTFSMDDQAKISLDKYLDNFTNKVSVLVNSDKAIENDLPAKMAPVNDIINIKADDPFTEDFPLKDREKDTDMFVPEVRKFDYYLAIDSKDRNIDKYPEPNNFTIDLAPASGNGGDNRGYIDRSFGNIESCELITVIIKDTSAQPDSSDAGGVQFPYLLLQFDELQQNYFGTNNYLTKTFAILTEYCKPAGSTYKYYRMVGDASDSTVIKVYNPRINVSRITTRLLLPDGTPFNFGSAYTNDTSNTVVSVAFRISTIQRNLATKYLDKATH